MKTANRDISSLKKVAQIAIYAFLEMCKNEGLNVLVTECYRSQERQEYLYCQGRTATQCIAAGMDVAFANEHANPYGSIVTQTRSSVHTSGYAWDICKNVRGEEYSDLRFFEECGAIARDLGIEWGGDWTSKKDYMHFSYLDR